MFNYTLYNCIYMKFWMMKLVSNDRKQISGCLGMQRALDMWISGKGVPRSMVSQLYICMSKLYLYP